MMIERARAFSMIRIKSNEFDSDTVVHNVSIVAMPSLVRLKNSYRSTGSERADDGS